MSRAPATPRPKYTSSYHDRHGKTRWRFRRSGFQCELPGCPGDEAFESAYAQCLANDTSVMARKNWRPKSVAEAGFVYFILSGDRVKIGFSKNPASRLTALQTGSGKKLTLYYATPGSPALERHVHQLFTSERLQGEWFAWSGPIKGWIAEDEKRRLEERKAG